MRAASLFHGSRAERTFALALALLGAVAAAQVIGALVLYLHRAREARQAEEPAAAEAATVAVSSSVVPGKAALELAKPSRPKAKPVKPHSGTAPRVSIPD
jgi:hypothetical protein